MQVIVDAKKRDFFSTLSVEMDSMPSDAVSAHLLARMVCLTLEFHAKRDLMEEELVFQWSAEMMKITTMVSASRNVRMVTRVMVLSAGKNALIILTIVHLCAPRVPKNVQRISSKSPIAP